MKRTRRGIRDWSSSPARSAARSSTGPEVWTIGTSISRREDRGEGGLAESRRAVEQQMVEGFAALPRGFDGDPKLLAERFLPDELFEPLRAKRAVEVPSPPSGPGSVIRSCSGCANRSRTELPAWALAASRYLAPWLSALRTSVSTLASDPSLEAPPGRAAIAAFRVKPSDTSAAAASPLVPDWSAPGTPAPGVGSVALPGANFSRSSTTSRCASFFPTPGSVTRKSASPASIASRTRDAVAPLRIPTAQPRPDPRDRDQVARTDSAPPGRRIHKSERVLANVEIGEERDLLLSRGERLEAGDRDQEPEVESAGPHDGATWATWRRGFR